MLIKSFFTIKSISSTAFMLFFLILIIACAILKDDSKKFKKIMVICPHINCKTKGDIRVSETIVINNDNLTTVNVPKDLVCQHSFKVLIDKEFKVHSYKKVDTELIDSDESSFEELKRLINKLYEIQKAEKEKGEAKENNTLHQSL